MLLTKSIFFNKSASLSVSLFVCLFVPYLLQNVEPKRAEILRDDSPWDKEGFRLKNIRIRRTVSRKIACIVVHSSGTYLILTFICI